MKIRSLDFYGFCEQNYMQPLSSRFKNVSSDYKVSVSHDKKNIITITDNDELLAKIGLKLNGQVLTLVDEAQDGFELASVELPNIDAISNARYDKEKKEIVFTIKKMDGSFDDLEIEVSDLVDIYNAGKGLEKVDTNSGHTFNIKVAEGGLLGFDENNALKVNYDSLVTDDELSTMVNGINTNVNTLVGNFIANEQKIDTALQAGITNVEKHIDDIHHILGTDIKEPSLKTQIDGNRTLIDALDAKIKKMPQSYSVDETNAKVVEAVSGKADASDVEALKNNLKELSSSTKENISELDNKKSDKADLNTVSAETKTRIYELDAKKSDKTDLEALSSYTTEKISELDGKKADKADIDALSSGTNNHFESNAKEIDGIKTRLNNAEVSLDEKKADIEELKNGKLSKDEAKLIYHTIEDADKIKEKIEVDEQEIGKKADLGYVNDELSKKLDASAYTPTDLSDYYKKEETSGKSEITTALNSKANTSALTAHTGNSAIHITADERTKWNNAATNSHTHSNKAVLDTITAIDTELSETSNNLVVNSAITKVIVANEKISSSALNELNDRKLDASAYTPTDLSDYYKKEETSGSTQLTTALGLKANTTDLTAHTGNATVHITSAERTKWNNADANSHTHANKAVLDKITAIDTELSETSNNLVVNSAITKAIQDNEKISSAALNELNDKKLDASAYTPTDLSDYYKKEETSGKTELDTALGLKANTSELSNYYKKTETSGKSEISTALNSKANTGHTHLSSDITDKVTGITESNSGSTSVPTVSAVMQVFKDNEKTISASLNDLNDKISQINALLTKYEARITALENK